MRNRWLFPLLFLAGGIAVAGRELAGGHRGSAVVVLVVFWGLSWLTSPLPFPRSVTAAEAERRSSADGRPIVYWRRGCQYCLRLRLALGRDARRAHWVDIWSDPAAAAAVRAVTGGNETVPTVVLAGEAHVNPDPRWLRERMHAAG